MVYFNLIRVITSENKDFETPFSEATGRGFMLKEWIGCGFPEAIGLDARGGVDSSCWDSKVC